MSNDIIAAGFKRTGMVISGDEAHHNQEVHAVARQLESLRVVDEIVDDIDPDDDFDV